MLSGLILNGILKVDFHYATCSLAMAGGHVKTVSGYVETTSGHGMSTVSTHSFHMSTGHIQWTRRIVEIYLERSIPVRGHMH